MLNVNHEIIVWARETAKLTRKEAVKKLGIRDARRVTALQQLAALENGEIEPTRPLLVKMAKYYRRPLLTFYLFAPPQEANRGADFRILPGGCSAAEAANLDALLRNVRARQSMVRAILEDEEEAEALPFIGAGSMTDGKESLLELLQALLRVDRSQYRAQNNPDTAFKLLRFSAEAAGIFVLLKSNLGSYHTNIEVELFRGFAIADDVAPFVVINNLDSKPAWSFTLLHELVHLLLGQTGISGARAESETERFCNEVAGEFLLSVSELEALDLHGETDVNIAEKKISKFAGAHHVSHTLVAYTAFRAGVIEPDIFRSLFSRFSGYWDQARQKQSEKRVKINPYVVNRHRIGKALIDLAQRMMGLGALTTCKAAKILGVKPKQVQALLDVGGSS